MKVSLTGASVGPRSSIDNLREISLCSATVFFGVWRGCFGRNGVDVNGAGVSANSSSAMQFSLSSKSSNMGGKGEHCEAMVDTVTAKCTNCYKQLP